MYRVVTRSSDEVIVITQDNKFSYYDRTRHEFAPTRPMQQGRYADFGDGARRRGQPVELFHARVFSVCR